MSGSLTARLKRAMATRLRSPKHGFVCWTPDFMGFGNVLYLLHWAATQRTNGTGRCWVLQTGATTPWLPVFPELKELLIARDDVGVRQPRVLPWSQAGRAALPAELLRGEVPPDKDEPYRTFTEAYLVPGARRYLALQPTDRFSGDRLVVNVRRGDYYSDPDNRASFSFPIETYLRLAVPAALDADGPVEEIQVVSDDPAWCREHLGFLSHLAPHLTIEDRTGGPVADFFRLVQTRRLVMTNSTFSYWAAMLGNAIHGDNHAQVWAPRFFDRSVNQGRSQLLDDRWSIVEDIPGGWRIAD